MEIRPLDVSGEGNAMKRPFVNNDGDSLQMKCKKPKVSMIRTFPKGCGPATPLSNVIPKEKWPVDKSEFKGKEDALVEPRAEQLRVSAMRSFPNNGCGPFCYATKATSALDSTTEAEILNSLKSLAYNRTSIFIAHRLTTAMQCDEIIVLENGKVVEQGPHDDLVARAGRYAELWGQQNNTEVIDSPPVKVA